MLRFHAIGRWNDRQVRVTWAACTRKIVPEVEALIEQAWQTTCSRPGVHLFDGPMCRMESWSASADRLDLAFSRTSYKPFLGTNLSNPQLADRFGAEVMANPVGVSPTLLTRDGFLMMGRRNGSVAYYPDRIHPFAGALEPRDGLDVFDGVRRELNEELEFGPSDVEEILCTGIAEDVALRQAEMIFAVQSTRDRADVESQLDKVEHHAAWAIPASAETVEDALQNEPALTPIARAAILLWGRIAFGQDWFDRVATDFTTRG